MNVRDLMNSDIVTLRRETELTEICAVMLQYNQKDFPVVNGEYNLVGMLYEENILKPLFEQFRKKSGEAPNYANFKALMESSELSSIRADQMMSPDESGVPMDLDVVRAGAIMSARKVRHLAVIADERVVGMISDGAIFLQLMRLAGNHPEELTASGTLKGGLRGKEAASRVQQVSSGGAEERRKFSRLRTALKVAYKLADAEGKILPMTGRFCICINVSLGGMLLEVDELLPLKHLIVMAFEIPGSGVPIKRLARVSRVGAGAAPGHYQTGVMFLALSVGETAAMEALLKTLSEHESHG